MLFYYSANLLSEKNKKKITESKERSFFINAGTGGEMRETRGGWDDPELKRAVRGQAGKRRTCEVSPWFFGFLVGFLSFSGRCVGWLVSTGCLRVEGSHAWGGVRPVRSMEWTAFSFGCALFLCLPLGPTVFVEADRGVQD